MTSLAVRTLVTSLADRTSLTSLAVRTLVTSLAFGTLVTSLTVRTSVKLADHRRWSLQQYLWVRFKAVYPEKPGFESNKLVPSLNSRCICLRGVGASYIPLLDSLSTGPIWAPPEHSRVTCKRGRRIGLGSIYRY